MFQKSSLKGCSMNDCIFCKIADKKLPAQILFENERIVAFRDIRPQAPTHILVIPRRHIPTVNDLIPDDAQLIGEMCYVAQQMALGEGIDQSGYRLIMNCNRDAGQEVFHIHLHLLGGRCMGWPPG
jgi:histidine triad (HIT) family protein